MILIILSVVIIVEIIIIVRLIDNINKDIWRMSRYFIERNKKNKK